MWKLFFVVRSCVFIYLTFFFSFSLFECQRCLRDVGDGVAGGNCSQTWQQPMRWHDNGTIARISVLRIFRIAVISQCTTTQKQKLCTFTPDGRWCPPSTQTNDNAKWPEEWNHNNNTSIPGINGAWLQTQVCVYVHRIVKTNWTWNGKKGVLLVFKDCSQQNKDERADITEAQCLLQMSARAKKKHEPVLFLHCSSSKDSLRTHSQDV